MAASLLVLGLAACSSTSDDVAPPDRPVEALYNEALDALKAREFTIATNTFDEVERQHPFSSWAPRAQLMSAYAHYQANRYDDAVNALDRFIQLHPSHEDVAYAYYLRALTYYEQIVDVARDQEITRKALESLDDVIRRYPDTDYARDAQLKRDLAFDHLAGKEMVIGRYYQRQGKLVSAMNRFTFVLVNYQTTSHAPEALHRLVECYLALGMTDEARKYAVVLGHNFPSSEWYSDSYALLTGEKIDVSADVESEGFFSRSYDYLFQPAYRIGEVDPDAEVLGTGIEATLSRPGDVERVTRAELPDSSLADSAPAGLVAADLPTTVPEAKAALEEPQADLASRRLRLDALKDAAAERRTEAEQALAGWQEYARAPAIDAGARQRAQAQVQTAGAAAEYWRAREDLLTLALQELEGGAVDAAARTAAEGAVAEAGLNYWQTVARYGQSETERRLAAKNADDAEKALAFWRKSGRGWLDRLTGSQT